MGFYWITGLVLLAYLILAWLLGSWAGLSGSDLWLLRGLLALLGLAGAGTAVWFHHRRRKLDEDSAQAPTAGDEIGLLLHEATQRIRNSKLGHRSSLRNMPFFFVLGDAASVKTTTILKSGLDPDLLAGHVYQGDDIAPTRLANVFYTREAVFLDTSANLLSDTSQWLRLIHRLRPARLLATFRRGGQAPRAAIVCVDCTAFAKPGARESATSLARRIGSRLHEISREMGINFPVYVLFTKLDRVPYFEDFVRSFTKDEAAQVMGCTLPQKSPSAGSVYEEDAHRRLTQAFDEVVFSLASRRLELLSREVEGAKQAGIYEFPREMRKLRDLMVQFLVDLGRPSQLNVNPFLRGFYFSGVRPVVLEDMVPDRREPMFKAPEGAGATRMLSRAEIQAQQVAPPSAPGSRRVPHWAFLTRLFSEILLQDQSALGTSAASSQVSFLRRGLVGTAAVSCLIAALGFTWSFFANHSMDNDVIRTATNSAPWDMQRLENLRLQLEPLSPCNMHTYVPLGRRWGLYTGAELYKRGRQTYLQHFQQLLLSPAQSSMVAYLRNLPDKRSGADYGTPYDTLSAYLITTKNPEQTMSGLSQVLMSAWTSNLRADEDQTRSASRQFDFYAAGLPCDDHTPVEGDITVVKHARQYLRQFNGEDQLYQTLLTAAGKGRTGVSFNKLYDTAGELIVDDIEVPAAFTKDAWSAMQTSIQHPEHSFGGGGWVLGSTSEGNLNLDTVRPHLQARYENEYIAAWKAFLAHARFQHPRDHKQIATKLQQLSLGDSPLIKLFGVISFHTNVGPTTGVSKAFKASHIVVPPEKIAAYEKIGNLQQEGSNRPYLQALDALGGSLGAIFDSPLGLADTQAISRAQSAADTARTSADNLERDTEGDSETINSALALLKSPIEAALAALKAGGADELNAQGKILCNAFRALEGNFPFSAPTRPDAPIEQVDVFFGPNGALANFTSGSQIQTFVERQRDEFVAKPGINLKLSAAFLRFYSHAVVFSESVYPIKTQQRSLHFKLQPERVAGLPTITLKINSESLDSDGTKKDFYWKGDPSDHVGVERGENQYLRYDGPWAVFKFFAEAEKFEDRRGDYFVEWTPRTSGQPQQIIGVDIRLRYHLFTDGVPIFQRGYLPSRCEAHIAN